MIANVAELVSFCRFSGSSLEATRPDQQLKTIKSENIECQFPPSATAQSCVARRTFSR
jgi:hypothetical protein